MKKIIYEVTEENAIIFAKHILKSVRKTEDLEGDKFLTIDELANLIGYKKTSIYGLVQKNKIPYHKKGKLFFLQSEIVEWLKSGKKSSAQEIQKRANEYFIQNDL